MPARVRPRQRALGAILVTQNLFHQRARRNEVFWQDRGRKARETFHCGSRTRRRRGYGGRFAECGMDGDPPSPRLPASPVRLRRDKSDYAGTSRRGKGGMNGKRQRCAGGEHWRASRQWHPAHVGKLEPPPGFEPGTPALRKRCSTVELRWPRWTLDYIGYRAGESTENPARRAPMKEQGETGKKNNGERSTANAQPRRTGAGLEDARQRVAFRGAFR